MKPFLVLVEWQDGGLPMEKMFAVEQCGSAVDATRVALAVWELAAQDEGNEGWVHGRVVGVVEPREEDV